MPSLLNMDPSIYPSPNQWNPIHRLQKNCCWCIFLYFLALVVHQPTQKLADNHDLKIFVRQPQIIPMWVNTICSSSQPWTYFPPLANMRLEICNHPHTRQICKPCNHPSTLPVTPWLWGIRWGYFLSENIFNRVILIQAWPSMGMWPMLLFLFLTAGAQAMWEGEKGL